MDGKSQLSAAPRQAAALVEIRLHREQPPRPTRQGELCAQRRRTSDADPQEPGAAGPASLQSGEKVRENAMSRRAPIALIVCTAMLSMTSAGVRAHDESKYPDMRAQWTRLA